MEPSDERHGELRYAALPMTTPPARQPPRHHRPGGYQNNHAEFTGKTLADVLRWRWDATRRAARGAHHAVELDWWEQDRLGGVDVALVRAEHGLADEAFVVLAIGETRLLPPR